MAKIVAVFGSGAIPPNTSGYRQAFRLGALLAQAGFTVMNGGYGGAMEASARGAKSRGGKTIGVTTSDFGPPRANRWIDYEKRMRHWHERLVYLTRHADACVALPGQLGTHIEIAVTLEMMRKGLIALKPVVLVGRRWKTLWSPYAARESRRIQRHFHFTADILRLPACL